MYKYQAIWVVDIIPVLQADVPDFLFFVHPLYLVGLWLGLKAKQA